MSGHGAPAGPGAGGFAPPLPGGRCFVATRRVGLSETTVDGRLRLDALARYLQDVATDDADDAGLAPGAWVLRRSEVGLARLPVRGEPVRLTTFCSAAGRSVAERRTTLVDAGGGLLAEAAALWVFLDPGTGRPGTLGPWFTRRYGPAAGGRRASTRLHLPDAPPAGAPTRPWPLRSSDLDVLAHVNNAAYWEPVEHELAVRLPGAVPVHAVLEHRGAVLATDEPEVAACVHPAGRHLDLWWRAAGTTRAVARVSVR